jgi:hypothetical protein
MTFRIFWQELYNDVNFTSLSKYGSWRWTSEAVEASCRQLRVLLAWRIGGQRR